MITMKGKGSSEAKATHFGNLSQDGESVLVYGLDPEKGPGKKWLGKRLLTPNVLASMLAGTFNIRRSDGKEVLRPRTEINGTYNCIDLTTPESLQDPRVLEGIDILESEGCDIISILPFLEV